LHRDRLFPPGGGWTLAPFASGMTPAFIPFSQLIQSAGLSHSSFHPASPRSCILSIIIIHALSIPGCCRLSIQSNPPQSLLILFLFQSRDFKKGLSGSRAVILGRFPGKILPWVMIRRPPGSACGAMDKIKKNEIGKTTRCCGK